jgi:hypothetical protein
MSERLLTTPDPEDFFDEVLADLDGQFVAERADVDTGIEHMYQPREIVFGRVARDLVSHGWSVFPQESDSGRKPGSVFRQVINWTSDHNLPDRLPSQQALELWCLHCAGLNVALALGPGSGNTIAIDIDVTDDALSRQCQDLAFEMLGETPFRRVGRHPKMALIYRVPPGESVPNISLRRFHEVDAEGNSVPGEDGIEVLSRGKPITIFGKHHKTGRYFSWIGGRSPLTDGPDAAPEVTGDQVQAYLERIDSQIRRFHRGASMLVDSAEWEWAEEGEVNVPRIRIAGEAVPWREDDQGRIVDGREQFISTLAYKVVRANPGRQPELLIRTVVEQFKERAVLDGRWSERTLLNEASSRVRRLISKVNRGEIKVYQTLKEVQTAEAPRFVPPPRELVEGGDGLDFLPTTRMPLRGRVLAPRPGAAQARAIPDNREELVADVGPGIVRALDQFFGEVYTPLDHRPRARVHIVDAPTGAGKTSRTIRYIAEDRRTYDDYEYLDEGGNRKVGRAPIAFLLPTYANIEELRTRATVLNLDPRLSDEDLKAEALALGLVSEADAEVRIAELRREAIDAGLRTMIFRGKIAAGCQMADKVSAAMSAGLSTDSFCKAKVVGPDGEAEEQFCQYYHGCPAIVQRSMIAEVDVVFMPHPFLGLRIPEELKHLRAVVADERVHHLFLHTTVFSATSLMIGRRKPKLTAREKEDGISADDLLADRNKAAHIALMALRTNGCPAEALFRYLNPTAKQDGDRRPGFLYVQSALRVCGGAVQRDARMSPSTPLDEVLALCSTPTGVDIREELQFWRIVRERMEQLQMDDLRRGAVETLRDEAMREPEGSFAARIMLAKANTMAEQPPVAKGGKDHRIQFILDRQTNGDIREMVRISWRSVPNWAEIPMLLLDASAAPDIVRKIWNGRDVVEHRVGAPLNVRVVGVVNRTFSNASVVGNEKMGVDEELAAARSLALVRKAISAVSGLYGWSRVVAGCSIVARRAINESWVSPSNVDWTHFGAMRGLDFAKNHAAAISVGRMEVPIRTIDGLVAALTFDDETPELPYDLKGDGMTTDGQPLLLPVGELKVALRSGHTAVLKVPMYPGRWGRLIQKQYREEELLQFLGRLRPVYRQGEPPVWFALSSVIPEGIVVDDIVTIDDLVQKTQDFALWEGVRRCGGVIDPFIFSIVCNDLFPGVDHARRYIGRLGFDTVSGAKTGRRSRGFSVLRWRAQTMEGHAFVRGDLDAASAFTDVFMMAHGFVPDEVHVVEGVVPGLPTRVREPDKIEILLGSKVDRSVREESVLKRVCLDVFDGDYKVKPIEGGCPPVIVEIPKASGPMTVIDLAARESLRRFWGIAKEDATVVSTTSVIQDAGENYEHLGSTVDDFDVPVGFEYVPD